jgi:DNA replication protein DnaC
MSSGVQDFNESITNYTNELKLPGIRKLFKEEAQNAANESLTYEHFLNNLLQKEYELRLSKRMQARIRGANFPAKKYLEDLRITDLPTDGQKKLLMLKTLDFIKNGQNIILSGNPGTGKTHIASGLGLKACLEGYSVLFTTVPSLITELKETRSSKKLRAFENRFEKYDLVICDEFGYISFDREGGQMLFTHLSLRAGRKSTIITTNLSFDRWSELFGDAVLTAAMVNRLTHKAFLVNMNGDSYRLKETEEWNKNLK